MLISEADCLSGSLERRMTDSLASGYVSDGRRAEMWWSHHESKMGQLAINFLIYSCLNRFLISMDSNTPADLVKSVIYISFESHYLIISPLFCNT